MTPVIPGTLRRVAFKIEEVEDDRGNQNGWWVYLKRGWKVRGLDILHSIHEDSLRDCLLETRMAERCECSDCRQVAR